MHIGFNCYEYPPCSHGGVGSFTMDLAENLVGNGFQVTVFGYYFDNVLKLEKRIDEVINGVRVIREPQFKKGKIPQLNILGSRIALYHLIRKLHKSTPFDLIESPEGSGWLPFGTPNCIPLITRMHGGQAYFEKELKRKSSRLLKKFEKMQLKKANHILAVSNYVANVTKEIFKINRDHNVIYNGIDAKSFPYQQNGCYEEDLIVFTGSINPKKGVENLIRSMNIVLKVVPTARLVLAGKDHYKLKTGIFYRDYLKSLIDAKYESQVTFLGGIDRITALIPLLNRAQLCCFPSFIESFGLAPLEAMALGKPVVFTKYASGPEVIEDGISGLLCDPKEIGDIAEKILLLLKDKELCLQIGKNGRERFYSYFDYHLILNQNIDFYKSVIDRNG